MKTRVFLTVSLLLILYGNIINPSTSDAAVFPCNNSIGGIWGQFGRIPMGCDVDIFIEPQIVHDLYEPLIYDTRVNSNTETPRYMSEMYASIRDISKAYYKERQPGASSSEIAAFQRAIFAVSHQETWWTHYRMGSDNKEKVELGDFNHGHGMMQVDDRSHLTALQQGKGANLAPHLVYAYDIYYSNWQRALTASCYQNAPSFRNRARSAFSAYNGGPAQICRWVSNTTGDQQYAAKYDSLGWENQVVDLNMEASVDLYCIANDNSNCNSGGGGTNPPIDRSITIDDDDSDFVRHGNSTYWYTKSGGINGSVTWTHAVNTSEENYAQWVFSNVPAGEYEIQVYIPQSTGNSNQAPYTIRANGQDFNVVIDQQPNSDEWVSLGEYTIAHNGDEYLKLSDLTGESYSLRKEIAFDAVKLIPQNSGTFTLANGKCLDVHWGDRETNGGKVQLWDCNGQLNQQWTFANGALVNGFGKCLDVHWPDRETNGGKVQIWDCSGRDNQQWSIGNNNTLVNGFGKCLDADGSTSNQNGGKVMIYECHEMTNQQWTFNGVIPPEPAPFTCPVDKIAKMKVGNLSGDTSVSMRSDPNNLNSSNILVFISDQSTVNAFDYINDGAEIFDTDLGETSTTWIKAKYSNHEGWVNSLYLDFVECADPPTGGNNDGRLQSFVNDDWYLPVSSTTLSSDESDHIGRGSINAWDISTPLGEPTYAMTDGTVLYAGCNNSGGYGCWVWIQHDNGFQSQYAHHIQGSIEVSTGQQVTSETQLGQVGWTGQTSFGPHVHFVIKRNGAHLKVDDYFDRGSMFYCKFCSFVQ